MRPGSTAASREASGQSGTEASTTPRSGGGRESGTDGRAPNAQRRGGRVAGLVSLPTSQKSHCSTVALDAETMRLGLSKSVAGGSAFVPAPRAGRIARMRRSVGWAARAHNVPRAGHRADEAIMITATYREGAEWAPKHVSAWLDHLRKWCKSRGHLCRYVWVAELTKRGRVHYHVALFVPAGVRVPLSDACGWWPHGTTRTEVARAAVPYLMKYLSKGSGSQKLPGGARMHGAGGLEHSMRRAARWLRYPGFVRARADIHDDWRPVVGGGWADPDGVCIPSEFERAWLGDGFGLLRVADYGRPFDASGPFSWIHRRPE